MFDGHNLPGKAVSYFIIVKFYGHSCPRNYYCDVFMVTDDVAINCNWREVEAIIKIDAQLKAQY